MRTKIGVPIFGYQNFAIIERQVLTQGYFSVNLGDNMQSIAIRMLLQRIGVQQEDIVSINRDTLAAYDGPPVAMVMNGVLRDWCFPTPAQIRPIFIGLCVNEKTVIRFREYFFRHQPIGCRDMDTKAIFTRQGISAFVSGCLTMTIPRRLPVESAKKVLIVYGSGSGTFPSAVMKKIPEYHLDCTEFVFHRLPLFHFPLDEKRCLEVEAYAGALLNRYATTAKLVITSLHHVATPCMALGIPVIICREKMDSRFSYLSEFTKVYTPETFDSIDWNPSPVNIEPIRHQLETLMAKSIAEL
jgi:hypothetical protein